MILLILDQILFLEILVAMTDIVFEWLKQNCTHIDSDDTRLRLFICDFKYFYVTGYNDGVRVDFYDAFRFVSCYLIDYFDAPDLFDKLKRWVELCRNGL